MYFIDVVVRDTPESLSAVAAEVERVDRQVAARLVAHPRLRRLHQHLELHPSEWLTTAAAAGIVCFQKNYFCAFFKRETGCTFVSWQHAWRVTRIAGLLRHENISITRAAERYGYLSMRAFERAFKAVFKVSAREFRREYRTGDAEPDKRRRKPDRYIVRSELNTCTADIGSCSQRTHIQRDNRQVLAVQLSTLLEHPATQETEPSETMAT